MHKLTEIICCQLHIYQILHAVYCILTLRKHNQLYLSGRSQQIQNCNHQSTARQLNFGVPQGVVLGPILRLYCHFDIF